MLLRGKGCGAPWPIGCDPPFALAGLWWPERAAAEENVVGAAWKARDERDAGGRACFTRPLCFWPTEDGGCLREAPVGDTAGILRPPGFLLLGMGVLCHLLHALAVIWGQLLK